MFSCRSRLGMQKVNGKESRAESGFIVLDHNKGTRKLPGAVPPIPWPGDKQSWHGLPTFWHRCQKLFLHGLSSQLLSERPDGGGQWQGSPSLALPQAISPKPSAPRRQVAKAMSYAGEIGSMWRRTAGGGVVGPAPFLWEWGGTAM